LKPARFAAETLYLHQGLPVPHQNADFCSNATSAVHSLAALFVHHCTTVAAPTHAAYTPCQWVHLTTIWRHQCHARCRLHVSRGHGSLLLPPPSTDATAGQTSRHSTQMLWFHVSSVSQLQPVLPINGCSKLVPGGSYWCCKIVPQQAHLGMPARTVHATAKTSAQLLCAAV
jgi:hypothetical protein